MRGEMLGRKERSQFELFISGTPRQLIPDDHVLVRVDRVLDLSWLRDEVADCYCLDDGRPGIDPEAAVRLMLAGMLSGIVHDRRLMREAQVNLTIRWFAGYRLHDPLPDIAASRAGASVGARRNSGRYSKKSCARALRRGSRPEKLYTSMQRLFGPTLAGTRSQSDISRQ